MTPPSDRAYRRAAREVAAIKTDTTADEEIERITARFYYALILKSKIGSQLQGHKKVLPAHVESSFYSMFTIHAEDSIARDVTLGIVGIIAGVGASGIQSEIDAEKASVVASCVYSVMIAVAIVAFIVVIVAAKRQSRNKN